VTEREATVGGKAVMWARLERAGLAVPRGFCVPAEAELDLAELERELAVLRREGVSSVAVRSSGAEEDGLELALAGLLESSLDVPAAAADVHAAALSCRASGGSARARSALGRPIEVGVLIQEMIHPRVSGVLFTRDPRHADFGAPDRMVLEWVEGHLEGLVGGRATPTQLTLSEDTHDAALAGLGVDTRELWRLAKQVEALVEGPADLEWAQTHERLVTLQARAITSLGRGIEPGLTLVDLAGHERVELPSKVACHDKVALRARAAELGIAISQGFVALARGPETRDVDAVAKQICSWGEFIAVLLAPFDLDGKIIRHFGTGPTAARDLGRFVDQVAPRCESFAFLLKELQPTAATGAATRLPDGGTRVELIHGHFFTKGFATPTSYTLGPAGDLLASELGDQRVAVELVDGKQHKYPVMTPPSATPEQLAAIHHGVTALEVHYPSAGLEFGLSTQGAFFLVDLYQNAAVAPPAQPNVLSHGQVSGRIRMFEVPEDALEQSIEAHVHSRRSGETQAEHEAEIIVVRRPYSFLDQLIYSAPKGTLGFICDGGALLCHLAVVMREHGVPGLVLAGATQQFVDGDQVTLTTLAGGPATVTLA